MSAMSGTWAIVLRSVISLIALGMLITLAAVSLPWLRRKLSPTPQKNHSMILRNRSNFPCSFELGINGEDVLLTGEVYSMGSPLPKARVKRVVTTNGNDFHQVEIKTNQGISSAPGPDLSKAKSKLTLLSPIISILSGFGNLLPGSLGTNLKETANSMRKTQMDARVTLDAPEMAKKQVGAMSSQGKKLIGKDQKAANRKDQTEKDHSVLSAPIDPVKTQISTIEYEEELPDRYLTMTVAEGEEINIELRLKWSKYEWSPFSKIYRVRVAQRGVGVDVNPPEAVAHEGFAAFSPTKFANYLAAGFAQALLIVFLLALQAGLMFWVWIA